MTHWLHVLSHYLDKRIVVWSLPKCRVPRSSPVWTNLQESQSYIRNMNSHLDYIFVCRYYYLYLITLLKAREHKTLSLSSIMHTLSNRQNCTALYNCTFHEKLHQTNMGTFFILRKRIRYIWQHFLNIIVLFK